MSTTDTVRPEPATSGSWEAVRDLPPSAKLVAKVLEYNDTMSQQQLASETLLPERTVRYAVGRLESAGVVETQVAFTDARKRLYRLDIEE